VRYLGVLLAWLATVALSAPTLWFWFQALASLSLRLLPGNVIRLAIGLLALALAIVFVALCVIAEHRYSRAPNLLGRFLRVTAAEAVLLALGYGAVALLGPPPL
jgi:polyferredoxin